MNSNDIFEARLLDLYVLTIRTMEQKERTELLDDLLYRRNEIVRLMVHTMAIIRDPDHSLSEQRHQDVVALEAEANSIIDHILKTFRSV